MYYSFIVENVYTTYFIKRSVLYYSNKYTIHYVKMIMCYGFHTVGDTFRVLHTLRSKLYPLNSITQILRVLYNVTVYKTTHIR